MKKKYVLIFVFLFSILIHAQETEKALYDQGKYLELIEKIQAKTNLAAADYFNLGNASYKLNRYGAAYAYFRKCLRLSPNDSDASYNLKLAQKALENSGQARQQHTFVTTASFQVFESIPKSVPWFLAAFSTLISALWVLRVGRSHLGFSFSSFRFWLCAVLFTFSWTTLVVYEWIRTVPVGVVVSDSAIARSGPGESFSELFKMPAGSVFERTSVLRDGWEQIRYSSESVGWVKTKEFLVL